MLVASVVCWLKGHLWGPEEEKRGVRITYTESHCRRCGVVRYSLPSWLPRGTEAHGIYINEATAFGTFSGNTVHSCEVRNG